MRSCQAADKGNHKQSGRIMGQGAGVVREVYVGGGRNHALEYENKGVTEHGARSLLLAAGKGAGGGPSDALRTMRSPVLVLPCGRAGSAWKHIGLNRSVSPFSLRRSSSDITACRSSSWSSSHSGSSAAYTQRQSQVRRRSGA